MAISVRGGPGRSEQVNLPHTVTVRFDQWTWDELNDLTTERGFSVSDLLRWIVQQYLDHPSPLPLERRWVPNGDLLAAILAELGKIGSNVNQCARVANQTGAVDRTQLDVCITDIKSIARSVRALIGGTIDP